MSKTCPNCENEYERIGSHWTHNSDCNHPSLTDKQLEISVGLLMGDGCIAGQEDRNPRLIAMMNSENYLKYVDKQFGVLGNGVSIQTRPNQQIYRWSSVNHPELSELSDWYSSGEKIWPDNINLTPTVLKHWYCGDGYLENDNRFGIAMANEIENTEKVSRYFSRVGLPEPDFYSYRNKDSGHNQCKLVYNRLSSSTIYEYMGKPLPDFEYKWPVSHR